MTFEGCLSISRDCCSAERAEMISHDLVVSVSKHDHSNPVQTELGLNQTKTTVFGSSSGYTYVSCRNQKLIYHCIFLELMFLCTKLLNIDSTSLSSTTYMTRATAEACFYEEVIDIEYNYYLRLHGCLLGILVATKKQIWGAFDSDGFYPIYSSSPWPI